VGPVAPAIGSTAHGHRGSRKGALIGMAIGVGIGLMMGGACESGDCTSRGLGVAAVLGAMGAGIGAMLSRHQGSVTNAPLQRGRRAVVRGTQSSQRMGLRRAGRRRDPEAVMKMDQMSNCC